MQNSKFRLPAWQTTFQLYKRLGDTVGFGTLAQKAAVEVQTAHAWARPVESDNFPTGTGKRNPLDGVLTQIALAHSKDPGLAREMAETPVAYVDYLDEQAGIGRAKETSDAMCVFLGEYVKEHTDIILAFLHSDNADLNEIYREVIETEAAFNKLKACLKEQLKQAARQELEKQEIRREFKAA